MNMLVMPPSSSPLILLLVESCFERHDRYTTNRVTPTNLSFGSTFSFDWKRKGG